MPATPRKPRPPVKRAAPAARGRGASTASSESPARLLNLGERTAAWLHAVGIPDVGTLRTLGAVEAYRRLKAAFPRQVSWVALYALHGALSHTHWNDFPPEVKAQMRQEVSALGPRTPR